ncbi:RimK-like ATP-grasp domain-containing protein [Onishia taeanensis]|uniref:RimK-like ATP-grasp domain-containing protein n=1 Tax=Onishia taeanensis TaxID=284577 RepID=A0A1G7RIT2_9GAMM|nr:hypothetical protein [Halomonas taeanensis]SDG10687.1 RimK-like ATP-grasp domain-containing protein [Halomonas taeanensis]
MNVDCLVISSIYDFSADLVVQELERRKAKYVRLNREKFENHRLTMDVHESSLEVKMNGANYRITTDLKAVYYRQPVFLRNTPGELLSIDEQLSRSQWMGFLRSLAIFDEARWMNPLNATYLAETKAYQLTVARKIGFKIPKTLIGNDYTRLREIENRVIIKSLDTVLLRDNNDSLFTYSTVESSTELTDENISGVPLTVQEYVSPKIDLRVTVIGGKVTAVKITSAGRGIDEDWRVVDRKSIEYTEVELPHDIERKCLRLLEVLGLSFGAIDLIESDGKYYFIEINPTGEWGWLVSDERRFDVDIATWLVGDK